VDSPITVHLKREERVFAASLEELNLESFGDTESEANEKLAEAATEYWLHLRDDREMRSVSPCKEHHRYSKTRLIPAIASYCKTIGRDDVSIEPTLMAIFAYRGPTLWRSHLSIAPQMSPAA
jgi:hypothetical protein